jgi:hypothetical protein
VVLGAPWAELLEVVLRTSVRQAERHQAVQLTELAAPNVTVGGAIDRR